MQSDHSNEEMEGEGRIEARCEGIKSIYHEEPIDLVVDQLQSRPVRQGGRLGWQIEASSLVRKRKPRRQPHA